MNLPRETNMTRLRSIYSRSVRKASEACRRYRANPNPGTEAARRDRVFAALAQRYKVAFGRRYNATNLHGAAKAASVRKAARLYRESLRRWAQHYDEACGTHAVARLAR